jgi:hypothetical protein
VQFEFGQMSLLIAWWDDRLFNTYAIPVALEKIGWKTYLVFVAWDIIETICIYFFAVETKQK